MRQQANRLSVDVHLVHKKYTSRQLVARRVNGLFCFFPAHLCSVILNNSTEPVHHPLIATTTTHYTVQDAWAHIQYLHQWLEGKTPLAQDAESDTITCTSGWQKYQQKLQLVKYSHVQVGSDKREPHYSAKVWCLFAGSCHSGDLHHKAACIQLGVQGGLTARVITGDRMEIGWQGFTSRAVKKIPPPPMSTLLHNHKLIV